MRANLHLHSRYSDGSLWPSEIVREARAIGLDALALTDHDTLGGTIEFSKAARQVGIRAFPGCEIDCYASEIDYKSEMLAYFPSGNLKNTESFLRTVSRRRSDRLQAFVDEARALFRRPDLVFSDLVERKLDGRKDSPDIDIATVSYNKVDFFTYLKIKGVIDSKTSYREFKQAYFETGLIPDIRYHRTTIEEACKPVLEDGGFLVLPHIGHQFDDDPLCMKRQKARLKEMLRYFRGIGVEGIELYYYRDGKSETINELVQKTAEPLGYFFTYGSDCHGPDSEKHTLGDFDGDFDGFPDRI